MAITTEQLTKVLDDTDVHYYVSHKSEGTILVPYPVRDQIVNVILHLLDDGELLKFRVPRLLTSSGPNTARLMESLLTVNYQMKLIKLSLDPSDGEVTLEIDLLIGDNTVLHEEQFNRCMACITSVLSSHLREFQEIVRSGETGGNDGETDDLLARLMAGASTGDDEEDV